jgi:hypothetical protein
MKKLDGSDRMSFYGYCFHNFISSGLTRNYGVKDLRALQFFLNQTVVYKVFYITDNSTVCFATVTKSKSLILVLYSFLFLVLVQENDR